MARGVARPASSVGARRLSAACFALRARALLRLRRIRLRAPPMPPALATVSSALGRPSGPVATDVNTGLVRGRARPASSVGARRLSAACFALRARALLRLRRIHLRAPPMPPALAPVASALLYVRPTMVSVSCMPPALATVSSALGRPLGRWAPAGSAQLASRLALARCSAFGGFTCGHHRCRQPWRPLHPPWVGPPGRWETDKQTLLQPDEVGLRGGGARQIPVAGRGPNTPSRCRRGRTRVDWVRGMGGRAGA